MRQYDPFQPSLHYYRVLVLFHAMKIHYTTSEGVTLGLFGTRRRIVEKHFLSLSSMLLRAIVTHTLMPSQNPFRLEEKNLPPTDINSHVEIVPRRTREINAYGIAGNRRTEVSINPTDNNSHKTDSINSFATQTKTVAWNVVNPPWW